MATSTSTTTNIEVCVRAQVELLGGGRLELADELVSPDFVDHEAPQAPTGPDGIRGVAKWLRGAFSDLSYAVDDAFAGGDRVALRCTASGTHDGEFLGHPPTGRRFAVQQIHIMRVADGRIIEHWACRDDVGLMRQLGLLGPGA